MFKLPVLTWIGNAAARLCGKQGDISAVAAQAGCSRQTVYVHTDKVQQILQDARLPGASRAELLQHNQQLLQENAGLSKQLAERTEFIEFNEERRKRLAVRAHAMGVSLSQIGDLFEVLLKDQPAMVRCEPKPSRATLGRWVRAACLLAAL